MKEVEENVLREHGLGYRNTTYRGLLVAELAAVDNLHRTLNAPASTIRSRPLRLTADSSDLLAVIKAEGKA